MFGPRTRASSFAPTGASLSSSPGTGTPTMPATAPSRAGAERERRGLGGAEAGHDQAALRRTRRPPGRAARPRTAGRVRRRRRTAACSRLKKRLAQHGVAAQVRQQHLVGARHGEVRGGRNLAQVAQRRVEELPASACPRRCRACRRCRARGRSCGCRRRCGSTAASRRAPAARRRGTAARVRIISWFEHSIRCVLMTPFGVPVDPEVNRILAIVSRADARVRLVDGAGRWRALAARRTASAGKPCRRRRRDDELDAGRQHRDERALERGAVGREHQRRAERARRLPQRAVVAAPAASRRRDRRVGHAGVHRRQRQQRVLDAVARQDHDRPIAATAADRAAPARCGRTLSSASA